MVFGLLMDEWELRSFGSSLLTSFFLVLVLVLDGMTGGSRPSSILVVMITCLNLFTSFILWRRLDGGSDDG